MTDAAGPEADEAGAVEVELYTSAFCAPCASARATLAEVARLVPAVRVTERDVTRFEREAEELGIRSTPTVVIRDAAGGVAFRAAGAPRLDQALAAVARRVIE